MEASRIQQLLGPYLPHPLNDTQVAQVRRYLDLLIRWNLRLNLTAIRDPEIIVTRHFGESLFAASHLLPGEPAGARVADVGSGAGFPGLAMRLYHPVMVTLVESRQRKAAFLREAARVLEFPDVEVFNDRAERYAAPPSAALIVTLRAVERFEQALSAASSILHCWRLQSSQASAGATQGRPARGQLALLIGAGQQAQARQLVPQLSWGVPMPIPRSHSRVLLVGEQPDL